MLGNLPSISLKLRQVVNCHLESVPTQSCLASLLLLVLVFQQVQKVLNSPFNLPFQDFLFLQS